MTGLVPFNKKESGLLDLDFDLFDYDLDKFFKGRWPMRQRLMKDTFKLDVQDKDKEYLIQADLPGIKKEEVKVDLDAGRLTISVEREERIDEEKKNYVHKERRYSSMSRSIYLADAKSDGIKAKLEEGVLNISIPKEEKPETGVKIDIE
ncbi:MAG TPA: heat-shock protein Hsp20 [Peptococcaceae bacterium]|nr:heat-shock protein Hsp20 [Peptococcaceae bacterium]